MDTESERVEVTWARIVKIYWLMLWRGVLIGVPLVVVAGLLLRVLQSLIGLSEFAFIWTARLTGACIGIVLALYVIKMIFDKVFSDFQVVLIKPAKGIRRNAT